MIVKELIEMLSEQDLFKEVVFDITRGDQKMRECVSIDGINFVRDPQGEEHICLISQLLYDEKTNLNLN